jgi:outer membrane receptor for ferrienterochelin and colicin
LELYKEWSSFSEISLQFKDKHEKQGVHKGVSSSLCSIYKDWLALWDVNIASKTKVHVWRLVNNDLALGSELQRRKIKDGVRFVAFGRGEDATRRFWLCPHTSWTRKLVNDKTGTSFTSPPMTV